MADEGAVSGPADVEDGHADDARTEMSTSRRRLIQIGAVGAAAVVGGAVAEVLAAPAAEAATGGNMLLGESNAVTTKGTATTLTNGPFVASGPTGGGPALKGVGFPGVMGTGASASGAGVVGIGTASTSVSAPGVMGQGFPGVQGQAGGSGTAGVQAINNDGGPALQLNSTTGPLALVSQSSPPAVMPPTSGGWTAGSVIEKNGHLWYCYVGGVGTASRWAKLSGSLVVLPAPTRGYDSRVSGGPIASHETRAVSLSSAVPVGASAVLMNLTVISAAGGGYLAVFAGPPATWPGTSNINFTTGATLGNNATSPLNSSAQVNVYCAGGPTNFVIDVMGFYP